MANYKKKSVQLLAVRMINFHRGSNDDKTSKKITVMTKARTSFPFSRCVITETGFKTVQEATKRIIKI